MNNKKNIDILAYQLIFLAHITSIEEGAALKSEYLSGKQSQDLLLRKVGLSL